jgi:uncharacterized SAM-binding protein YcdF (DUF218 family)
LVNAWELTNATARLLLPPGGLIVLGLVGLALARLHTRAGLGIGVFALLSLYALATPVCSRSLLQTLEDPYSDPVKDRNAAAIIVLGGGSYSNAPEYGGDTVSKDTLERLRYAALLQRRTGKPVMVSGGNPGGLHSSEAEQMRIALHELGVTPKWIETASKNTVESARIAQRTFKREGIDSAYIVTHAWHMPRAKMAFQHAGLRVVPAPTGYTTAGGLSLIDFVPSPSGLRDSYAFFHEVAGIAWYRLKFARER